MATLTTGTRIFGPLCATGAVTGTGASIYIQLDFKPIKVELYNIDDAGGQTQIQWSAAMPDASGIKIIDSGAGVTNALYISTLGVTPGSGGFTIGADTDMNVAGESIVWVAWRSAR